MTNTQEIIDLFANGASYSKQTQEEFARWLIDNDLQQEKQEVLQHLYEQFLLQKGVPADQPQKEHTWERICRQLQFNQNSGSVQSSHSAVSIMIRRAMRVAAIFLLPLLSMAAAYLYVQQHTDVEMVECYTAYGELKRVVLPDSTVVRLNAGSVLIYPAHFTGSKRRVYLCGEANFSVTKDRRHPFVVSTSSVDVKVLGTVFNVSAYNDDNIFSTTLKEGEVEVLFRNGSHAPLRLKPNQQLTFDKSNESVETHEVNFGDGSAWENGEIIARSTLFESLIKMAERRYGVNVNITTGRYNDARITAEFISNESLEEFFSACAFMIPGLKYKIEGERVYVY